MKKILLTLTALFSMTTFSSASLTAQQMWEIWSIPLDHDNDSQTYSLADAALYDMFAGIWLADYPANWNGYGFDCDACIDNAIEQAIFYYNIPRYLTVPLHPDNDPDIQALNNPIPASIERLALIAEIEAANNALTVQFLANPYATPAFLEQGLGLLRLRGRDICGYFNEQWKHRKVREFIKMVEMGVNIGDWDDFVIVIGELPSNADCEAYLLEWMVNSFFPLIDSNYEAIQQATFEEQELNAGRPISDAPDPEPRPPHLPPVGQSGFKEAPQ